MSSDDKITEIYCMADDFCKFFDSTVKKYSLEENDGINHKSEKQHEELADERL